MNSSIAASGLEFAKVDAKKNLPTRTASAVVSSERGRSRRSRPVEPMYDTETLGSCWKIVSKRWKTTSSLDRKLLDKGR